MTFDPFTERCKPAKGSVYLWATVIAPEAMSSDITINVSGRQFQVNKTTLLNSPYFRNMFERWNTAVEPALDGSYSIDADLAAFEHLLCYMRRPSNFPLLWTKEKGFDYVLYNKLEAEADFFLLHDLRDWIRQERYKDAITTIVEIHKISEPQSSGDLRDWKEVDEVQWCFNSFKGDKTYRCPLDTHGLKAWDCGIGKFGDGRCVELDRLHGP